MPVTRDGKRRSDRHKQGQNANPFIPVTIATLLLAVLGGAYWFAQRNYIPTDDQTLCRLDQPPLSLNIVLIDVTETLSQGERVQILSEIERLLDSIPRFGRLEVYALGRSPADMAAPRLAMCNPGRGAEVSEFYANPTLVESRWQNSFAARLEQTLSSVVSEAEADQSLILEGIRSVSLENFAKPAYDLTAKQLFVFSDFLQNVPGTYSQYSRPLQNYEQFKTTPYAAQVQTSMQGISISAFYIARPETGLFQTKEHQQFWMDYFTASGATVERVKRVFGD